MALDSAKQMHQRIASTKEDDVVLGMFFDSVLTRVAELEGAPRVDSLRKELLKGKKLVGFFRYPVVDLLRVMDAAAGAPGRQYVETLEDIGRSASRFFFESPVGKTLSVLAGDNCHRVISSAPASYKACASFGDRSYERCGEREALLTFRRELLGPAAQSGVIRQTLESACGIKATLKVDVQDASGADFTIRITW